MLNKNFQPDTNKNNASEDLQFLFKKVSEFIPDIDSGK